MNCQFFSENGCTSASQSADCVCCPAAFVQQPVQTIINTTPHPIIFRTTNGTEFTVQPCGFLLNAKAVETPAGERNGVQLVKTQFVGTPEGEAWLSEQPSDVLIIGSIIAAQAFPGKVLALTPAPGFERVPVNEKRMNPDKFTIF